MIDIKVKCRNCGTFTRIEDDDLKRVYQQGKADAIEEFRNKLFSKLCRLTLSMWYFKLFDDALQETFNELKEHNNE